VYVACVPPGAVTVIVWVLRVGRVGRVGIGGSVSVVWAVTWKVRAS